MKVKNNITVKIYETVGNWFLLASSSVVSEWMKSPMITRQLHIVNRYFSNNLNRNRVHKPKPNKSQIDRVQSESLKCSVRTAAHTLSLFTPPFFVEAWYRNETKRIRFFFTFPLFQPIFMCFFAATELKSNDIIYARSFLSSRRINDFLFRFCWCVTLLYVCVCAFVWVNKFVRIYRLTVYQMKSSASEKEWTGKYVITKKMVRNVYKCICLSVVHRELQIECIAFACVWMSLFSILLDYF